MVHVVISTAESETEAETEIKTRMSVTFLHMLMLALLAKVSSLSDAGPKNCWANNWVARWGVKSGFYRQGFVLLCDASTHATED